MAKNSVHVEPIWFSLDNLTLCGRSNYSSMVLHPIKENFRRAEAFLLRTGRFFFIVFLRYRDKLPTKQKKFRWTRDTVWHKIFAFLVFAIFPAIHKISSRKKNNENIFPAKFFSRLNILCLKFTTQKYSTKKSRLFNYNSPLQFSNKTVYNELVLYSVRIP